MDEAARGLISQRAREGASYSAAAQAALLRISLPISAGWALGRRITLITIVTTFFSAHSSHSTRRNGRLREGWRSTLDRPVHVFLFRCSVKFSTICSPIDKAPSGSVVGVGIAGAWGCGVGAPLVRIELHALYVMLLGACVLLVALVTTLIVNARETTREGGEVDNAGNETLGPEGGFGLIARDRYLLWIAVLIVLLNVVNTTGNYLLNRFIVSEAAARFGTGADALSSTGVHHGVLGSITAS